MTLSPTCHPPHGAEHKTPNVQEGLEPCMGSSSPDQSPSQELKASLTVNGAGFGRQRRFPFRKWMSFPVYLSPSPPSSEHPAHTAIEDTRPRALLLGAGHEASHPLSQVFCQVLAELEGENRHQSAELPSCGAALFLPAMPHWWQMLEGRVKDAAVHRGSSSASPFIGSSGQSPFVAVGCAHPCGQDLAPWVWCPCAAVGLQLQVLQALVSL